MPTSFEGLEYTRYLFKEILHTENGGCHADVYLPGSKHQRPCPVALYIHGGGFTMGDTFHVLLGHFDYLLNRGFCVVSVEYRLMPHARLKELREDWLDSYRWTTDPTRTFFFGGSAGGAAVLYLGGDSLLAGLPPARAIYSIYPSIRMNKIGAQESEFVDYTRVTEVLARYPEPRRTLIKQMLEGPACTAYNLKTEQSGKVTGRRAFYEFGIEESLLVSCLLEESSPPFSPSKSWDFLAGSNFPPTVLIKAMKDTLVDPAQTTEAYITLEDLGVDVKLIVAEDMLHGDGEGENDMLDHPPREKDFWRNVFNVALDWCITRTLGGFQ